ncbi:MAG: CehA/McbA family metallohydrolase [Akkermansiaceae bacterium]|nr:CehA/McbA family metallohydrolase [Akkermansiaceae bacterium]
MKRHRPFFLTPVFFVFAVALGIGAAGKISAGEAATILDGMRSFGVAGQPEWNGFSDLESGGAALDLSFSVPFERGREHTLFVRHRGVKQRWDVMLNDRKLGSLPSLEADQITAFAMPADLLREPQLAAGGGLNRLLIRNGSATPDDVELGDIRLVAAPKDAALGAAAVEVRVLDAEAGTGVPCRITFTTPAGTLAPLKAITETPAAVREGVVYVRDGKARLTAPAGDYVVWASRGFEWSVAKAAVSLQGGGEAPERVTLEIRREAPVPGWISVDSHIHTLTDSGHGDATLDERMLTIAGEGLELAVATDHNKHADYAPAIERTGTRGLFREVTGNEVTTKLGHFNAFPVEKGAPVPDATIEDWGALLPAVRRTPGVRIVILNHPRNLHSGFVPMGPTQFDTVTGKHRRAAALAGLNGMEVVTSAAMQSDIMLPFRDWFALLNRGHRLAGVGSSDTHDVNRFILGQARTYAAADDSGEIDLDQVWKSHEEGRLLVSMGLLAQIRVDGRHGVGDLAAPEGDALAVEVTVTGPSWTRADRLVLYGNGFPLAETRIGHPEGAVEKARHTFRVSAPRHDVWLVAVATGPGVTGPFWEMPRPYQPSSPDFNPRVIGATNPVWIDGDRDGVFSAARPTAQRLTEEAGADGAKWLAALAETDEAVAIQAAELWAEKGAARPGLDGAPDFVRRACEAVWRP